ncbi:MAG: hypothetical protein LBN23_01535 [Paludibacter sp.]|jgi:tetratricopeptide (TPR) repeat protein|nr:hypothetical protein [Paludibacter sp.]
MEKVSKYNIEVEHRLKFKVMKKNIFIFLIFMLINYAFAFAQTAAQGEELFNNKNYSAAKDVYAVLLKRDASALNSYRYARCCYELGEYEAAIAYFQKSGERYPLKYFYLGEIYFETYRFKEAETAYSTYFEKLAANDSRAENVKRKIKKSAAAAELLNRTEDIMIIDSIAVEKDKLLDFMHFNRELGSLKCEKIQTNDTVFDKIIFTTQRGDRKIYSDIVNGQTDIFEAIKLLDKWADSVPISHTINTSANENYPFLLLDGVTLYFAADGEKSLGGYDIFITRYSPATKEYVQPENAGMPFNSPANDYMMIIDEQQNIGWFATDRRMPEGKVMIYKFLQNNVKKPIKTADYELLRNRASLRTPLFANDSLRQASNATEQTLKETNRSKPASQEIFVIINDTTLYRSYSDFHSHIALSLFKEYSVLKQKAEQKKAELNSLRERYLSEKEKAPLAEKIMQEELNLNTLEKSAAEKLNDCVREENAGLKK